MTVDIASLGIRIDSTDARTAARDLNNFSQAGARAEQSTTALADVTRKLQAALAFLGVGTGVGAIIKMADEYTKLTAQLRLASNSQREYAASYEEVKRIANSAQQDLSATATLYARIANGTRELGTTQKQVAGITETVNLALKVSGATAAESASAQLQLAQAFATGTLRGEEFNAVNEAAPRLMQALADGLGVSTGALRSMSQEGAITSQVMANTLPKALEQLREESKQVQTISGAFSVLKNNITEFTGVQAEASGTVTVFAGGITALANNLDVLVGLIGTVSAAKLAITMKQWSVSTYDNVAANRALLNSNVAAAEANVVATAAARATALARIEETQASVLAANSARALAIAESSLAGAQAQATTASAAHTAALAAQATATRAASIGTTALRGAVGLLGGPIGAVVTALGLAATAYSVWGDKGAEAEKKVTTTLAEEIDEYLANLNKQIAKLKERNELAGKKMISGVEPESEGEKKREKILAEINKISKDTDLNIEARTSLLMSWGSKLNQATLDLEKFNAEQKKNNELTRDTRLAKWYGENGTAAQKLAAEMEKLKKEFGEIPPEMEKLVRAKFIDPAAKKSLDDANKAAKEYADLLKRINGKESGLDADYLENLALLKKGYEGNKLTLEQYTATVEAYKQQQPGAIKLEQEKAKAIEESSRVAKQGAADIERLYKSRADTAARAIEQAEQEAARNEQLVATFGMEKSAIEALEVARLQEQLAQRASIGMTLDEITETEKLIAAKQRSVAALAQFEELSRQKQFWIDVEKTAHDTFVSIMDGSKNAAQRLKETFKNVFFDWLYSMTLKPWIVNLQGQFSPGSVAGLSQTAGGAASALSSGVSLAQTASSLYSAFTGGMTLAGGVGTGFVGSVAGGLMGAGAGSGLTSSLGMAIGEGILNVVGPGVASALSTGIGAIATALPWVGGALAVVGLAKAAFGRGPKEVTGTTLTGNLGADGFDGKFIDAWTQKGGWFRSDKSGTTPRDVDAAMAAGLGDAYAKITAASRDYAKALGIDADFITGRSQSLSIALTKDAATNEKAITEFFAGVANTIAGELVPDLSRFIKEGEVASSTLQRLAVQYTAVDAVLKAMGTTGEQAFGAVGVASLAAREQLLTLTGGLDAFASQTSFFSQNFLSEAERLKPVQDQVTAKMTELGFAGVTTVDAFKNVVVGLQTSGALAHEVGATAYAELLKIAPAFKVVADAQAAAAAAQAEAAKVQAEAAQKAADDAAAAAQRLADINKPYLDRIAELETALGYAVTVREAEKVAVDASTQAYIDKIAVLEKEKGLRDAQAKQIADFMANNYGQNVVQIEQQQQAAVEASVTKRANLEIQLYNLTHTAAEQLAATRERELAAAAPLEQALLKQIYAQQDLADAATAAAKQIEDAAARARAVAQERAGIERSILQLQGNTAELRKLELAALDPANRALQESFYALQDKMAAEAAAAAQAQAMAEAQARAAEESRRAAEALKQAWQSATDSIFDEVARIRGLLNGGGASLTGTQSAFAIATAQARAGDQDAAKLLPGLSKTLLDLAEQNASSLIELRRIQARTAASLQETGMGLAGQYSLTIPSYDVGTNNITRSGLAMVHQGEEIVPAASSGPYRGGQSGDSALAAEVRALREEMAALRRENGSDNRGMARDIKRVADGLEMVTDGWDAMRVKNNDGDKLQVEVA